MGAIPVMETLLPAQAEDLQHAQDLLKRVLDPEVERALEVVIEFNVAKQVSERISELANAAVIGAANVTVVSLTERHRAIAEENDPFEPLTAATLGKALGVSDETIRRREANGEIFSIMRPTRQRGREFPAFQAWDGIAGEPLARILKALQPESGAMAHSFFVAKTMDLEGLAPIEVMVGRILVHRPLGKGALELLKASASERLAYVEGSAIAFRNEAAD